MCLGYMSHGQSREAAKWGIFHPRSQATTGQEKVCNVDQTVRQVRIPTELKLITFCICILKFGIYPSIA